MEDKQVKDLIDTLDGSTAPEGLKERMLKNILQMGTVDDISRLTPFQKWFFEMPLRAACFMAVSISATLWAVFGSNYANMISGLVGVR